MKLLIVTLMCFVLCASAYPLDDPFSEINANFSMWKSYHNKVYETEEEEVRAMENFEMNLNIISNHNYLHDLNQKSFRLGMNHLGDMNVTESNNAVNGFSMDLENATTIRPRITRAIGSDLPASVDWRNHGYVTRVKNQGYCQSCWAFGVTGVVEGQMKRKTGRLVSLSEQNLVDCVQGNRGCYHRGHLSFAYEYARIYGIDTEESYPYENTDGTCRFSRANIGAKILCYVSIEYGNEQALKQAVARQGPIAVAIDSRRYSFIFYTSGVYDEPLCSSAFVDHAALVVGYGTDARSGLDYWIVKNSWGPGWGEGGYIRMSRGKFNQCGIASFASYPLV